jgi:hypothetical protein
MVQALIDYIKTNGLEALAEQKKIDIKYHKDYPQLVMLKYRQIESDFSDPIVRLCRGIILDSQDDWRVVNWTFTKFLNYGQGGADKIDFSKCRFYEKVDGSLCQLYWYDDSWHVATSGTPDASGQVGDFGFTFAELFWRVWAEKGYCLPTDTNCCYSFELMTPWNLIVVQHKDSRLVLHGGRNLKTFRELNPIVEAHNYGWECVKTFPFDSLEAALAMAADMKGVEQEGFVCVEVTDNGEYKRVKMKCKDYTLLSHLKDSCLNSKRQMLEVIRNNESEEFLVAFPQFKDLFYEIKLKYERLLGNIEGSYQMIKDIEDQKAFAMQAKKSPYSGPLFNMRHGNITSFKQALAETHIRTLEQWLGLKTEEQEPV